MEDDVGMKELVELIFGKKVTVLEDLVARNSSIPDCLLTKDFSKKMEDVMYLRKVVIFNKWPNFFDENSRKILSSHETYLMYVMAACLYEHECYRNIFDSFISVCALVTNFSVETLRKTGVDFSDLNPDIIMVFYQNVLKRAFHRRKDFLRFGEYISGHKYLAWEKEEMLSNHSCVSFVSDPELCKILMEELSSKCVFQELPNHMQARLKVTGISLAQEVLSNTSVELPTLPNEPDLIRRLVASRKRGIAEKRKLESALASETLNVTSHDHSSGNSKTNYVAKHKDNIANYENIIQAVIRRNQSKNLVNESEDNKTHEVGRILEHLKNTIKSLIEVLDKCDKE